MLQIYNSYNRKKEVFTPLVPNKIGMYVCGITVYDHCHIGHARSFLVFDMVVRYLRAQNYQVNFVRNITDIDDKIIKRAAENNEDYTDLTARFIRSMHKDTAALGMLAPNLEPHATEYMPQMIALVENLIVKDYAYVADNGDVYYAINKFANYGKLSNRNLQQLEVGSRVAVNPNKRDPLDFVLWKHAKSGEPAWNTPWGTPGRPGWHLECSAMAIECLGETFDIHGGGCDLQFPHHENECAQSEAATGKKFVNYWLHNGFLQVNNEKMSKSLNNFITIQEILADFDAEILRYLILSSHYRSPIEYSLERMQLSKSAMLRLYMALRDLPLAQASIPENSNFAADFIANMNDDFNTPRAFAVLFAIVREINKIRITDTNKAAGLGLLLIQLAQQLGLLMYSSEQFLQNNISNDLDSEQVEKIINDRNIARENKDWNLADSLRDSLDVLGVVLEDTPSGTLWRSKS